MKRSRFVASALVLAGLLGAAEVRSASVEQKRRMDEFRKKALAARKAQGLDKNPAALYAKYPTPELKLEGAGAAGGAGLEVAVGTEATLVVTGRFSGEAFPHVDCPGVELLSQKVTENRLELRVKVAESAVPGICELRVFSPVSMANEQLVVFRKVASYKWDLALANGMKVKVNAASQKGVDIISGNSEWFSPEGKSLGTRLVNVNPSGDSLLVTVQRTQQELEAATKALSAGTQGPEGAKAQQEMQALQAKMQKECMSLPSDKMAPCLTKYSEQMKAASAKMREAATAGQKKAAAASVGCQTLRLKLAEGGKVSGKANGCGAPGEVAVTGTVTVNK